MSRDACCPFCASACGPSLNTSMDCSTWMVRGARSIPGFQDWLLSCNPGRASLVATGGAAAPSQRQVAQSGPPPLSRDPWTWRAPRACSSGSSQASAASWRSSWPHFFKLRIGESDSEFGFSSGAEADEQRVGATDVGEVESAGAVADGIISGSARWSMGVSMTSVARRSISS